MLSINSLEHDALDEGSDLSGQSGHKQEEHRSDRIHKFYITIDR